MKHSSASMLRLDHFFVILAVVNLILAGLLIPSWISMMRHVEDDLELKSESFSSRMKSEVEHTAEIIHSMNLKATALARVLHSSLSSTNFSFVDVETKVAPSMFQALLVVPHITQISYAGVDGLFFSYYIDRNQIVVLYANSSFNANSSLPDANKYTWYKEPVDPNTGKRHGDATISHPRSLVSSTWFREALNSTNGVASLDIGWNHKQDHVLLNAASVNARGVVSVGILVKHVTDFFSNINSGGSSLYLVGEDGEVLLQGLPNTHMSITDDSVSIQVMVRDGVTAGHIGKFSCNFSDTKSGTSAMNYQEAKYTLHCAPVNILGKQSVYILAVPDQTPIGFAHQKHTSLSLLLALLSMEVITNLSFVFLATGALRREMHLRATLIKQMEATWQAESKSTSRSNAFAQASHDIRASLAGITGLIEISYDEVSPGSELAKNLKQMEACAKDLLALLNSFLDTSKIEAGKMQLEEEEYDLAQLLEDVVDLYHPVAMRKGVDVVLDPSDGSVLKQSLVKGDRGKLKQILSNLLSNAVKFTDDGYISVRAWVQEPSFENPIQTSVQNSWLTRLSCLFSEKDDNDNGDEASSEVRQNPGSAEFIFEVNDTGKGIPKEKRKSVFENYTQVKETAQGQGGTGLGLGIVQSLVCLMGGDIEIADKDFRERGTCFRFNVFLTPCEASAEKSSDRDLKPGGKSMACSLGLTVHTPNPGHNPSLALSFHSSRQAFSPKSEGSRVVLLIQSEERRRICRSFMEGLGIKVLVASQWQDLRVILKKVRTKVNLFQHSSSGESDMSLRSGSSDKSHGKARDVALSSRDDADHILPAYYKRNSRKNEGGFVLLIIDASSGSFQELCEAVAEFRQFMLSHCHEVVWLDKPTMRNIDQRAIRDGKIDPRDIVMSKPLHGTRLLQVIRLLPEFGGSVLRMLGEQAEERPVQHLEVTKLVSQETGNTSTEKPLSGKKVLVADDGDVMRKLAVANLLTLGATIHVCENGAEAVESVREGLSEQRQQGLADGRPYDYILMDCLMPIMDGYEAARQIRLEEKHYGVRMPIIALTAHSSGSETEKIFKAGMDFHMQKPANAARLMKAINQIESR